MLKGLYSLPYTARIPTFRLSRRMKLRVKYYAIAVLPSVAPRISILPPGELRLLDHEPGAFSMFVWKNITILTWLAPATGATTKRVAEETIRVASACPEGFSNIHLLQHGIGLPTAEARHDFAEMMNRHPELACVGVALLGSGFWASALQSAITGIRMLSPKRSSIMRIHDSMEGVAEWLPQEHLKLTGVQIGSAELQAAMTQVFSETLQQAESGLHPVRKAASVRPPWDH